MYRIGIPLFLSLLLAGCFQIGPDYEKPEVEIPQSWRFTPAETAEAGDSRWWEQFGDPKLTQLIELALTNNRDLKKATASVEEYIGLYGTSRSVLFPQLTGSGSGADQGISDMTYGAAPTSAFQSYQAALNLSWQVDIWGNLRRATEAAKANLYVQEEVRRGVVLTLVSSVANAYVQLLELDQRLDIARRTLSDRQEAYRIAQVRFNGELNSDSQVKQAESEVHNATVQLVVLENLMAQQEHQLSVLLGRNPGAIERGLHLGELHLPAIPAGLPSELLSRRPDIRQAEQSLIAANANIGVAKGQYLPQFTITGAQGGASAQLSSLLSGPAAAWSLGGALAMPIFTAGKVSGQVKSAEARQQEALYNYQTVLLQAFQETENALINNIKVHEQVVALDHQVASLREYLRLAWLRYNNGLTNYLEVLDAQRNLFNIELALATGKSNALQARVNLYKAFGGGWINVATENRQTPPAVDVISYPPL